LNHRFTHPNRFRFPRLIRSFEPRVCRAQNSQNSPLTRQITTHRVASSASRRPRDAHVERLYDARVGIDAMRRRRRRWESVAPSRAPIHQPHASRRRRQCL